MIKWNPLRSCLLSSLLHWAFVFLPFLIIVEFCCETKRTLLAGRCLRATILFHKASAFWNVVAQKLTYRDFFKMSRRRSVVKWKEHAWANGLRLLNIYCVWFTALVLCPRWAEGKTIKKVYVTILGLVKMHGDKVLIIVRIWYVRAVLFHIPVQMVAVMHPTIACQLPITNRWRTPHMLIIVIRMIRSFH